MGAGPFLVIHNPSPIPRCAEHQETSDRFTRHRGEKFIAQCCAEGTVARDGRRIAPRIAPQYFA
jgi:hypothetical protein